MITAVTKRMSLCSCVALTSAGRRMPGVCEPLCINTRVILLPVPAMQGTDLSGSSSVKTLTSALSHPDPLPVDHPLSSVRSAQQQQGSGKGGH
ncbi:hypothetical protein E2C01_087256 [Portunus trituberculatus]|uniref:Uncharacterized protein n=1 Tax=Portunus trituberculatus TaxID=210409 RepID=A0A5B7J7M9_PORTR|nr:hypothetical protein [Portunus trituberculatus]